MRQVPLIIEPDPDDPDFASVLVQATVAGRPYPMLLNTGAARSQLVADEYTLSLSPVHEDSSSSAFGREVTDPVVTVTDLVAGPLPGYPLSTSRAARAARATCWGWTYSGGTAATSGWPPGSWTWRPRAARRGASS